MISRLFTSLRGSHRITAVSAGIAASAALFGAAPAMATVTQTQITSPGDPYYSIANEANSTETRTVTGTSDGTTGDVIDLRCYAGGTKRSPDPGQNIPVNADGSFTADVDVFDISNKGQGCILRAVPDATAPDNAAAFKGPRMLITRWEPPAQYGSYAVHGGATVSPHWYMAFDGLTASTYAYDVSNDGLYFFSPTNPSTLTNNGWWESYAPVQYGAALYGSNQDGDASSIKVDGKNAFTVGGLPQDDYDGGGPEGNTLPTGVATPDVSISQDANGMITVVENQPLYYCQDTTVFPPTSTSCATVTTAGVRLDRTLQSSDGGKTFTVADNFVSTDSAQHTVGTNYYNEANNYYNYVVFRMPGEQSAALHDSGDVFTWQSAPATMFWYDSSDEATSGSAALTELQKPDSTTWSNDRNWYQNYGSTTIPAGGSTSLTHIYQVAFKAAEVEAAAGQQTDKYGGPTVTITSPADNSLTQNAAVLVTGTASDNVGVKSLMVNGAPTTVNPDGSWSQTIPLSEGGNTITAVATDNSGQSSQASVRVIRGASACRVPTVTGVTQAQATAALQNAACSAGTIRQVYSGTVKKGSVVSQGAAPGTLLEVGTKVAFTVSKGAFPSARVAKTKIRLRGNKLIVSVRCAKTGAATNGTIKLRKVSGKHQTLGTRAFQCPSGKARNVSFSFSKATTRALRGKNTKLDAYIVSRGPDGAAASRKSRITVLG